MRVWMPTAHCSAFTVAAFCDMSDVNVTAWPVIIIANSGHIRMYDIT